MIIDFPKYARILSRCTAIVVLCYGSVNAQAVANRNVIVSEEGQLSLTSNIVVTSSLAGSVSIVNVKPGDTVHADDRLAQLDAEIAEAELVAAEAIYQAAKLESENDIDRQFALKTLGVRERELAQSEQANRRYAGTVTGTEIAKLQLTVEQSRLSIEQAEHERQKSQATADEKAAAMRIAQARLSKHSILAPVNGLVAEVSVDAGEWVDAGRPIMRLISLDPIRLECFVDGRIHGPELVGRAVEFRLEPTAAAKSVNDDLELAEDVSLPQSLDQLPTPDIFRGQVVFVSSELHPVTGQTRLWAELPNPKHQLRAGMRGRIEVLERTSL